MKIKLNAKYGKQSNYSTIIIWKEPTEIKRAYRNSLESFTAETSRHSDIRQQ